METNTAQIELDPSFNPADQVWPCLPPEETPEPLLDLDCVWDLISESKPIPTEETLPEDVNLRNATALIRDLKQHLLASTRKAINDPEADRNATEKIAEDHDSTTKGTLEGTPSSGVSEVSTANKQKTSVTLKEAEATERTVVVDEDDDAEEMDTTDKPNNSCEEAAVAEDSSIDSRADAPQSVLGASLMLKFRWEDRTVQKAVPHRTYEQFADFLLEITSRVTKLKETNFTAFQAVLDAIALELTPVILARLLDGIETLTPELEKSCDTLLQLCARSASPREMHLSLLGFTKKIDSRDFDDVAYLTVDPLMRAWTQVIPRIPRKRAAFLSDALKVYDKMMFDKAVSTGNSFGGRTITGDEDIQDRFPGRNTDIGDIMLRFLKHMVGVQREHRESSAVIKESVDFLGRSIPSLSQSPEVVQPSNQGCIGNEALQNYRFNPKLKSKKSEEEDIKSKDEAEVSVVEKSDNQIVEEAADWVKERAMTLSRVLQLLSTTWNNLSGPPGDGIEEAARKATKQRTSKLARELAAKRASVDKAEEAVVDCMRIIDELGWCNPALVCQVAASAMQLEVVSESDELMRGHIGVDARSKNQRKKTSYSMAAVGQVVCGFLRPETLRRWGRFERNQAVSDGEKVDKDKGDHVQHYKAMLEGSGFDLLTPEHALDLALPFVMTMISQSAASSCMAGIIVMRSLLEQFPEQYFKGVGDVVKMRCGTNTLGREGSLLGTGMLIMKAVSGLDDGAYRAFALETLHVLLKRCQHPFGRFLVMEMSLGECNRMAVAGQLVTELKNVLHYSNINASQEWWSQEQASELTDRFVKTVLPRYLAPRREMLAAVNAIVPTAAAVAYVAMRDARAGQAGYGTRDEQLERRRKLLKAHVKLGRECVRAVAAVAEYDRKNVPSSKLKEASREDAKALYTASGQALNQCVAALSSLSLAESSLSE